MIATAVATFATAIGFRAFIDRSGRPNSAALIASVIPRGQQGNEKINPCPPIGDCTSNGPLVTTDTAHIPFRGTSYYEG